MKWVLLAVYLLVTGMIAEFLRSYFGGDECYCDDDGCCCDDGECYCGNSDSNDGVNETYCYCRYRDDFPCYIIAATWPLLLFAFVFTGVIAIVLYVAILPGKLLGRWLNRRFNINRIIEKAVEKLENTLG